MKFLKTNWVKLVTITLALTAGIFALISTINAFSTVNALHDIPEAMRPALAANGPGFDISLSQAQAGAFMYLAIFLSCAFIITFAILKILKLNKKIAGITLITGSVISLSLFITGIALGSDFLSYLSSTVDTARQVYDNHVALGIPQQLAATGVRAAQTAHITQIAQVVIFVLVFGVTPLVIGIKKLVCSCKSNKITTT